MSHLRSPDGLYYGRIRSLDKDDPVSAIKKLEDKFNSGKKFPKAFRDYLFLAGESSYTRSEMMSTEWENVKDYLEESILEEGLSLGRPYMIFENGSCYHAIFFLDEDKDDPDIYDISIDASFPTATPVYTLVVPDKPKWTLVSLIEMRVRHNLENRRLGYDD